MNKVLWYYRESSRKVRLRRGEDFTEEIAKYLRRSFGIKQTYGLILVLLHASARTLDELLKLLKLGFVAVK